MKFGVQHPSFRADGRGLQIVESLRRLVTLAENLGFDSFWVMDHFHQIEKVGEPQEPMLEGWTTIAVLAAFTSRIKLGTLVTGNAYRHPSVLAKIGATLDVLSRGRLFMGIGAAWNKAEAQAYGIPFPNTAERMRRLEESVQIIRKMWTEELTSFNGKFYQIRDAYCNPKPIQKPSPPILIGGSGEHELLKIVAKYADACNIFGSPETVKRKLEVLREHCRTIGRRYDSILKTRLGHLIIGSEKKDVDEQVEVALKGVPEQQRKHDDYLSSITYGTPEEVRRQMQDFREAGIEYFIVNFDGNREIEALNLFAGVVKDF